MSRTLEATAYHEAGHAVAAFRLRCPIRRVSVVPDGDSLGRVTHTPWPTTFNPEYEMNLRIRKRLEARVIVCYAGPAAEKRFLGKRNNIGSAFDRQTAVDLASYVEGGPNVKRLECYLAYLNVCAEDLVEACWPSIEILAKELLVDRKLSVKRVRRVLKDAFMNQYGIDWR